jgi:hypothetical protein
VRRAFALRYRRERTRNNSESREPRTMGGSSKLDKLKAMQKEGKKGIV